MSTDNSYLEYPTSSDISSLLKCRSINDRILSNFTNSVLSNYFVQNITNGKQIIENAEIEISKVLNIKILRKCYRDFILNDPITTYRGIYLNQKQFDKIYDFYYKDYFKKFQCFKYKELCLLEISILCDQQHVFVSIADNIVKYIFNDTTDRNYDSDTYDIDGYYDIYKQLMKAAAKSSNKFYLNYLVDNWPKQYVISKDKFDKLFSFPDKTNLIIQSSTYDENSLFYRDYLPLDITKLIFKYIGEFYDE